MKNKRTQKWITLGMCLLLFTHADAQFEQTAKIVSDQREDRAEFGTAVCIKNNYAILGAPRETIATGAAYLYELNDGEWNLLEHITAPDGHEMAEFGGAVKLLEEHVIIASGRADLLPLIRAGAVYVYDITQDGSLSAPTKLIASDAMDDGMLGMHVTSLDAEGTTIVVGAPGVNGWTGAVYIFELIAGVWTETQIIQSPTAQQFDTFGIAVSIHGDQLVIGANESNNRSGEAHVYQRNTNGLWEHVQAITPSLSSPDSFFGTGLSIYDNIIAVGAYGNSASGGESVFIFEKSISGEWLETQIISGSSSTEDTFFGWDCKIQGNQLIISAPHIYGFEEGEVLLYLQDENGLWVETYALGHVNNVEQSFFGWNIAIDQARIIVGAPRDDYDENGANELMDAGAAFVFSNSDILQLPSFALSENSRIYPVPAGNFTTVESLAADILQISLYDLLGKSLQTIPVNGSATYRLNLTGFSEGLYFVSVQTSDGKTSMHKIMRKN